MVGEQCSWYYALVPSGNEVARIPTIRTPSPSSSCCFNTSWTLNDVRPPYSGKRGDQKLTSKKPNIAPSVLSSCCGISKRILAFCFSRTQAPLKLLSTNAITYMYSAKRGPRIKRHGYEQQEKRPSSNTGRVTMEEFLCT